MIFLGQRRNEIHGDKHLGFCFLMLFKCSMSARFVWLLCLKHELFLMSNGQRHNRLLNGLGISVTFASIWLSELIFAAGRFPRALLCRHTGGTNSCLHHSGVRYIFVARKSLRMEAAIWFEEALLAFRNFHGHIS